ncbi:MAG: COQ9 family protein [Alphaproteobacteria bacterium]|nr:COQ9 family protein [Alphaproteobacteria bacterium]MCY4319275.1 COQ9 family protein [Alphaproteobacteria bacterium]
MVEQESRERLREIVLEAALPHIAFDGWTVAALRAGAAAAGLEESEATVLFPRGPLEAIEVHMTLADRHMIEDVSALDPQPRGAAAMVRAACHARLERHAPHREAVRRAVARLSLPQNAPLALRSLYRTVDAIWLLADDRSTDFSYYTKRATLGAIYAAVLQVWLNDRSEDLSATWAFLDRRLEEVAIIGKTRSRLQRCGAQLSRFRAFSPRFR